MDVSPLWRLVIVAGLGLLSGLLAGVALYRGEIGPRTSPLARRVAATAARQSSPSRGSRRRGSRGWTAGFGETRRRAVEVTVVTAVLVSIVLFIAWLVSVSFDRLGSAPQ